MRLAKSAFLRVWPLCVLGVLCASCGCVGYERLLERSRPVTPDWVRTTPPPEGDLEFFVGRSVARNTLDERQGMNKAFDDAVEAKRAEADRLRKEAAAERKRQAEAQAEAERKRQAETRPSQPVKPRTPPEPTKQQKDAAKARKAAV